MFKNFGKGLVFGSVIGATLALLYAPRNGKELRQKMKQEQDEGKILIENLEESIINFNQSLVNLKETAQEILPTLEHDMTDIVEKFQFQTNPRINEIEKTINELNEHLPK